MGEKRDARIGEFNVKLFSLAALVKEAYDEGWRDSIKEAGWQNQSDWKDSDVKAKLDEITGGVK